MNRDLLERVADRIEAHPECYDQEQWLAWSTPEPPAPESATHKIIGACGTRACVAGHTLLLAAGVGDIELAVAGARVGDRVYESEVMINLAEILTGDSLISAAATELLGLRPLEGELLFHGLWRAKGDDVPRALRAIASGIPVLAVTDTSCLDADPTMARTVEIVRGAA